MTETWREHEEAKQNESLKSGIKAEKCKKIFEEIQGRKKISNLISEPKIPPFLLY